MAETSALFLLSNYITTSDRLDEQTGINGDDAFHAHYTGASGPNQQRRSLGEIEDASHSRRVVLRDTDLRPERQLQRGLAASRSRQARPQRAAPDGAASSITASAAVGSLGDHYDLPPAASRRQESTAAGRTLTGRGIPGPYPTQAAAAAAAATSGEQPPSPALPGQQPGPAPLPLASSQTPASAGRSLWGDTLLELGPTAATTAATAASLQDFLLMTAPFGPVSYEEHQRQKHAAAAAAAAAKQQQQLLSTGVIALPGQALSNSLPSTASAGAAPEPHSMRRRYGTSSSSMSGAKHPGVAGSAGGIVGGSTRQLRRSVTALPEPHGGVLFYARRSADGGRGAVHDSTAVTHGGLPSAASVHVRTGPGPRFGSTESPPSTPASTAATALRPSQLQSAWPELSAAAAVAASLPSARHPPQGQQQPVLAASAPYGVGNDAVAALPPDSPSLRPYREGELQLGESLLAPSPAGSLRRRQRRRCDTEGGGGSGSGGAAASDGASGDGATAPDFAAAAAAAAAVAAAVVAPSVSAAATGCGPREAGGLGRRQSAKTSTASTAAAAFGGPRSGRWRGWCWPRRLWGGARERTCGKCFPRARDVHGGQGHLSRVWVCDGVDPRVGGSSPWQVFRLDLWSAADKYLPIFVPSFWRSCWDAFLLMLLMFTAIVVPMEVAFRSVVTPAVDACNLVVLGIFWIDIFVQFRTAFVCASGELVRDGRQISIHYCRTWLPLDLASSIPWAELLKPLLEASGSRAGAAVALARLPRLLRLMRLLHQLDRYRYANVLRMVRLMVLLMLLGHWTACAWHAFAEWIPGWPWLFSELTIGASLLQQYSVSLYFAYVLVVGSDNPQLPPQNNLERTFMIGVLIMGSVMSALVVSNMAMLVANYNSLSSRYVAKAALAADALRYVGAPPQHRARVAEYYDFLTQNDHPGPEADNFLCELPRGLLEDIKWSLYGTAFNHLWLFAGCAEPFMAALQARLTISAFTRGEVIYKDQDVGREMFIVRRGCVALRAPSGDLAAFLRPGEVFGELALLPDLGARRRTHTAVAVGSCDMICLAARDLALVCKDHPDSGAIVQERLYQQYRHMLSGSSLLWFYDELTAQPETDADYDLDEWFQVGGLHLLQSVTNSKDGGGDAAADTEAPPQPVSAVDANNRAGGYGSPSTDSTAQYDAGNVSAVLSTAAGTAGTTRSSSDDLAYTDPDVGLRTDRSGGMDALGLVSRDSSASSWASFFEAVNATSSLSAPRVPQTPGFRNAVQPASRAASARGTRKPSSLQRRNDDGAVTAAAAAAAPLPPLPGAAVLDSGEVATAMMAPPLHMGLLSTADSLLAAFAARRSREFVRQRSISVPRRLEALLRFTSGRETTTASRLATATGPAGAAVAGAPLAAAVDATAAAAIAQTAAATPSAAPEPLAAIDGLAFSQGEICGVKRNEGHEDGGEGGEGASNASRATGEATTISSSSGCSSSHINGRDDGGKKSGGGGFDDKGGILKHKPQPRPCSPPKAGTVAAGTTATGFGSPAVQPSPPPSQPSPSPLPPPSASNGAGAARSGRPEARKHTTSTSKSQPAPPPPPLPPPAAPPPPGQLVPAAQAGGRILEGADGGSGGDAAAAIGSSAKPASPPEPLHRRASGLRLSRPPTASPFASNLVLSSDEHGWGPPSQEGMGVERDLQSLQRQPSAQTPKRGLLGFASLLRRFNVAAEEPSNAGSGGGGGGGEGGGGGGSGGGSGGARERISEADNLRPADSASLNTAALLAAANASTASTVEGAAEAALGDHGGGGQRRIRRFISGGSRNSRFGTPMATPSRLRSTASGDTTLPGNGLSDRRHVYETAMSTAPAWLIARASRDQWPRRPAVQQHDDLVGRALQALVWALSVDRDASQTVFGANDAVGNEAAGGGRRTGPLFELSAGQKVMLLSLVDWTVRRFGADASSAVREAVQMRVRRVEQALSGAFQSVLSSLAQIEQTVASLNDSAAVAKSRLAAIEKTAAEAAGDGVLAPNLLGLLDTDSGLNLNFALERLQQAGASDSSNWSEALLAAALASYAGAATAAAEEPKPPPPGAAAPSRMGSDALARRRSSGILHPCNQGSALSDAPAGAADSAPSPTPSDRRASLLRRSSLSRRFSAGGSSLANSPVGNGGSAAAATDAGNRIRRASSGPFVPQRLQQWRQATVVDSTQQMVPQLRRGDIGMSMTTKERPSRSGSGVVGLDSGSLSGGLRRTSTERRWGSMDQQRSLEHRRWVPNVSQGGAAAAAAVTPLPASVDDKPGSDMPSASAAVAGNPAGCANTSPVRHLPPVARSFTSGNLGSGTALQRPSPLPGAIMPLRSGGAARSAVLDDSVIRDGLGGGSRSQQPTLLPSERPGARRALAPVLRTTENGPSPDLPLAASSNSAVRVMPFRRVSTSTLQPQLTMQSAASSAGGGGGSMIAMAPPQMSASPVVAAQPHRTAAARAATAAAAAAACVTEADAGPSMGGGSCGGSNATAIRRKISRGPLAGDSGDVSVRGGKNK